MGEPIPSAVGEEVILVILLLTLIIFPRVMKRYGLPSAITSLRLGFGAQLGGLDLPVPALNLHSTLGIVALFLFAGLEINASELQRDARFLIQFGVLWTAAAPLTAAGAAWAFDLETRPALLVALGLLTPSAGFILSSVQGAGMSDAERFAVRTKVIAAELLALAALFPGRAKLVGTSARHRRRQPRWHPGDHSAGLSLLRAIRPPTPQSRSSRFFSAWPW